MKGLLIFPILKDLNKADGIVRKNEGITRGFKRNDVDVDVLEFTSEGVFNGNKKLFTFNSSRYLRIYQYWYHMWGSLNNQIAKEDYDFIWFRLPIINRAIARFVRNLKKQKPNCRIILEYGAYPYINELSSSKKILYRLNKGNERITHHYSDFIITYCGQEKVDNLVNIPIDNGIDFGDIPLNTMRLQPSGYVNFISVSSLKKWHACERFIFGMIEYIKGGNVVPVHFDIVGEGPELEKLETIVKENRLEEHVSFHRFKTGKDLDDIYQRNHVAVGTLGFHRVGVTNSSSLKNREYFARGLPILLSTQDQDMPPSLPFVHYVPEGESPINISDAVKFALEVYELPEVNQQIRDYAESKVSWKSKIRTVLDYLDGQIKKPEHSSKTKIYS